MNTKHERYDLVFSLGAACACSVALRRAKLQFASFPLDWLALGTPLSRAKLVASHFEGWLEKDDFKYLGTNPVNGLGMFDNVRTGLKHLHDFADGPIEKSYDTVRAKYARREARLYDLAEKSRRILCAYVSRPTVEPVPPETLKAVEAHMAGSHRGKGWETFTQHIIEYLNENRPHLVFILWGRDARSKKPMIDQSKHFIIESAHPSPLSAHNGFFGSKPFSKCNAKLAEWDMSPIKW